MHVMEIQSIKQRFDIIGDDPGLNRALDIATQVAGTDLSVLVTGESGVGKEAIPQIIHQNSPRKHGVYIAVNCGAIPEGTIDSELFGHEKGSFTGANEMRKGYFEVADGGTIFLDEVAELPLSTQVRLLRILQTGEFYKVGSSKVQKTNVRVVAATNVNLMHAIHTGKFREDLYYRLNTVPISIPALRERKGDIYLLFRKFALDFADKYKMPVVKLTRDAQIMLQQYRWPGNIRQLKNVAEQMSVLEKERLIDVDILQKYLPADNPDNLPVLNTGAGKNDFISDRDILYKMIFQLKQEVAHLKEIVEHQEPRHIPSSIDAESVAPSHGVSITAVSDKPKVIHDTVYTTIDKDFEELPDIKVEQLSIPSVNADLIKKCLEKHNGRRKDAAAELGISERTLYRKIKELNL
ncbi:MAG: sigma-54-dependent Fis family transcriptional regulator [Bacteroidales bacterium]|nr:sigma-54-dependent Fis family transcriptional regulator [Bacteroidales bacterium]MBQ8034460.1 sigma-54-dependent Fis family transcriptional regulator [Bacteroidales bacterium]MBR4093828.1 sigma-54-dependent Fis family transcriptional regulator [Bacteroidales bacterium]